jgi:hypothetical protein
MKQQTNKSSNSPVIEYILYSIDNYRPTINCLLQDILTKFLTVVIEYLTIISEKITIKNRQYYLFILERGLETIIHVFSVLFYYTKNLELTVYHSQKAYYFYIEFIEQISDDNITFLQLSSKDAILFVYKKTIYELNNEYKKNLLEPNEDEKMLLNTLDIYIHFYKTIIINTLYNCQTNITITNKINMDECYKCMENVTELLIKYNKPKKSQIELVYNFTNMIFDKSIDINVFYDLVLDFVKKLVSKKKWDELTIKRKIYDPEINSVIDDKCKLIDFIFKE